MEIISPWFISGSDLRNLTLFSDNKEVVVDWPLVVSSNHCSPNLHTSFLVSPCLNPSCMHCFLLKIIHTWGRYHSHITKIVGYACTVAHNTYWAIFLTSYGFGKEWTSSNVFASQGLLPANFWAQTHKCPVSVSSLLTSMGPRNNYMTNYHSLTHQVNILFGINGN